VEPLAAAYCVTKLNCIPSHDELTEPLPLLDLDHERPGVDTAQNLAKAVEKGLLTEVVNMSKHSQAYQEQWSFLWRIVTPTLTAHHFDWESMIKALEGGHAIDWAGALNSWRALHSWMLKWLTLRETRYEARAASQFPLHDVFSSLQKTYSSTLCRPEGMVDLDVDQLMMLGTEKEASVRHKQHLVEEEKNSPSLNGWVRLKLVKSGDEHGELAKLTEFIDANSRGCDCMCFRSDKASFDQHLTTARRRAVFENARVDTCYPLPDLTTGVSNVTEATVDNLLVKRPDGDYEAVGKSRIQLHLVNNKDRFVRPCVYTVSWLPFARTDLAGRGYIANCRPEKMSTSWSWWSKSYDYDMKLDIFAPHQA
jgi:hypothetical protein